MATFRERLNQALGPRGYDDSLRRSVQSVVLFEAKRCVEEFEAGRSTQRLPLLRVFQRKAVHWAIAKDLLASTDLQPYQCTEVLWRTCTNKQPLGDDNSWRRAKVIAKELSKLADQIRSHQTGGLSSDEAVDLYVQGLYVSMNLHNFMVSAKEVFLTSSYMLCFHRIPIEDHHWLDREEAE